MLSQSMRAYLGVQARNLTLIWIALQAAAAIYYIIARLMAQNWAPEDRPEIGFAYLFYVWAALMAVASLLYQRWAFSDARLAKAVREGGPKTVSPAAVMMSRAAGHGELDERDKRLAGVYIHLQNSYIITWAFQEAVALVGLVMAIVTRDASNVVLFNLAAVGLLFTTRPAPLPFMESAARLLERGEGGA